MKALRRASEPALSPAAGAAAESAAVGRTHEWLGRLGDTEPSACAGLGMAERIELVWPITVAAWAFSGKPWDESRLRRDVERLGRRER